MPTPTRPRLSEWESTWAFVTGGGLLLIIMAFGLAAIRGADSVAALNGMLLIGVLLFIGGVVGWLVQYRPWLKFDDQSTPLYTGHDEHGHEAAHAEAPAEAHAVGAHAEPGLPAPPVIVDPMTAFPPAPPAPRPAPLPAPPVIVDPITTFPPATPAAPEPLTHVEPVEQKEAELKAAESDTPAPHDNLQLIEGIGPKIASTLMAAGIYSYAALAKRSPEELEKIVRDAGVRMVGRASNWVEQARIAASGDMAALKQYKDSLRAGRTQN